MVSRPSAGARLLFGAMVVAIPLAVAVTAARGQETCEPAITQPDGSTSQVCVSPGDGTHVDCATQPHQGLQPDGTISIDLVICPTGREEALARQLRRERRQHATELRTVRRQLRAARREWRPTVDHAIALASAAYGVDRNLLRGIASCESTLTPTATNGRYVGLFQFGSPLWNGTGFHSFDRTDPYAASLAAARTISRGGIRHWNASRGCWGGR